MRLYGIGFKILVQVVADTLGPEPEGIGQTLLAHLHKGAGEAQEITQVPGFQRGGVRGAPEQVGPDQPGLLHHIGGIALVGIGVAFRVAGHLPVLSIVIVVIAVVVAVAHERDAAPIGHHLQAVSWQFQVAGDFWSQQAAHVGAVGVSPAPVQFAADGGAADIGIALQHRDIQAGLGQVGSVGQAIVAGADHDGVIFFQGYLRRQTGCRDQVERARACHARMGPVHT